MKICQVLAGRGAGGLERHFVDLCNGLAADHDVVAVAHAEFAGRLGPQVHHETLDLTGWRHDPRALCRLARTLRRHRPDIIHAQANKAAAMVAAVRLWLGGARRVATIHNLKRGRRAFASFDHVIAVSRRAAAQLDPSRVTVVYNGIAPIPPSPAPPDIVRLTGAGPVAFTAGRMVPAKGFDLLLQAWTGIAAPLIMAGDGPERPRLQRMVQDLALGDRVHLVGFRTDVPALLLAADLVVLPSRREGFPYFLVESLAARRVVVAARVPGADELLPAEYIVDVGDVPSLQATVAAVLADPDAARAAFEPVWRRAREELTLERMVAGTERVYRAVLEDLSLRSK